MYVYYYFHSCSLYNPVHSGMHFEIPTHLNSRRPKSLHPNIYFANCPLTFREIHSLKEFMANGFKYINIFCVHSPFYELVITVFAFAYTYVILMLILLGVGWVSNSKCHILLTAVWGRRQTKQKLLVADMFINKKKWW